MGELRDRERTRRALLHAAHQEFYEKGFSGGSIDGILQRTKYSRGALFNLFRSKKELGYAVVDDVIRGMIHAMWIEPLQGKEQIIEPLLHHFREGIEVLKRQRPILGCPLNNLAQEMGPRDELFRAKTEAVFHAWTDSFTASVARSQRSGELRNDLNPAIVATHLVALIEGVLSLARNSQEPGVLDVGADSLESYLEGLRR